MVSDPTAAEPLDAILEELRALSRKIDSHSRMVDARFGEVRAKIDALETSLPNEVRVPLLPRKKRRLESNPPVCPDVTHGECEKAHHNPPSVAPLVPHSHRHVAGNKNPLDAKPVPGEHGECQEAHQDPPSASPLVPHSRYSIAADKKPLDTKPVPGEHEECQEAHHDPPSASPLVAHSRYRIAAYKKPVDAKPELVEQINILVRDAEGNEIQFKIKRSTALKKLKDAYCNRLGFQRNLYRFLFDGHRIGDADTPEFLDMQELDTVDAMVMLVAGPKNFFY